MSTTRTRSLTITVDDTDVRILMDGNGIVTVSNLPIGKVVQKADDTWAPASLSGVVGRGFDLQREAIAALATRFHRQAAQVAAANI